MSPLADAFGAGKITVGTTDANNALTFQVANGNTLSVNSSVNELLGLGENGLTSYLDTSRTLGDLLGEDMKGLTALRGEGLDGGNKPIEKDGKYYDTAGNLVDQDGNRIDSEGNKLYSMKINGVEIGTYTKDTAAGNCDQRHQQQYRGGGQRQLFQTHQPVRLYSQRDGRGR